MQSMVYLGTFCLHGKWVIYCTYPSERLDIMDEVSDLCAGCASLGGRCFEVQVKFLLTKWMSPGCPWVQNEEQCKWQSLFSLHAGKAVYRFRPSVPLCCCFGVSFSLVPWNGLVREVPEAAAGEGDPINGRAAGAAGSAAVVKPAVGVPVAISGTVAERGRGREDRWCWSRSCRRGDTIPHVPGRWSRKIPSDSTKKAHCFQIFRNFAQFQGIRFDKQLCSKS